MWGPAFSGIKGGVGSRVPRSFWVHYWGIWNIGTGSKAWEGKSKQLNSRLSRSTSFLKKKKELPGWCRLAFYTIVWLAMCVFQMDIFEVDASAIKS